MTRTFGLVLCLAGAAAAFACGGGSGKGNDDAANADPGARTDADGGAGADAARDGGGSLSTTSCHGVDTSGGAAVTTKLPVLPELANVNACVNVDAAHVTFGALDDANDYRIYPLPKDEDITIGNDGAVTVKNAIYRCAGTREALRMLPDQPQVNDNAAGGATILNGDVEGFTRAEADATLGYVYDTPGPGRTPVYVLGSGEAGIEEGVSCGRPIFASTRPKLYTTDAKVRDDLVAKHARDDGIAFYVPAAGAGTRPVYEGTVGDADTLRWIDGAEGAARQGKGTTAFAVLTAPAHGTLPLMRVHVAPYCGKQHDELVAGTARYKKVSSEGDQPLTALRWSGISEKTVLVIEALDQRCPYQGHLSPVHAPPLTDNGIDYPAYMTLDDLKAASPTGEVFVNGQNDAQVVPKAIARSFIEVSPVAAPPMDFFATFNAADPLVALDETTAGAWVDKHFKSATYEMSTYATSQFFYGAALGELWFAYSDVGADVNGKVRITPNKTTKLDGNGYLHVTTEVDVLSTARRYPQILISDQLAPVQDNLANGTTLLVQPKDEGINLQVQVCDHRTWDVNNQCPLLPTFSKDFQPPGPPLSELTGTDNTVKLDLFVSSDRLYMFVDEKPYACTAFPAVADDGMSYHPPSGTVSVTWGDVLYHSGVDISVGGSQITGDDMFVFHRKHLQTVTRRHFDNLGFKAGESAPSWDETLYPCVK